MNKLPKLVVVLGPTASGKTSLAIKLASQFNGEIISADSRQVYKYMKIGTDVPDGENTNGKYIVNGITHHLIHCVDPDDDFTLAHFKRQATKIIKNIIKDGKLPILAGGTGLYVATIVDNFDIPNVKQDLELRKELESKTLTELVSMLKDKDIESYGVIDLKNPRRVLRALEVVIGSGKSFLEQQTKSKPDFDSLQIGIMRSREEIYKRINARVDEMIDLGLINEIKNLLKRGYGWKLNSMSGLGYRQFKDYLEGVTTLEESVENLKRDTRHYAKRQISWFKRDKNIRWLASDNINEAEKMVADFIE